MELLLHVFARLGLDAYIIFQMMMFRLLYLLLCVSSLKACPLKTVNSRSGCYCGIEIDGKNYIHCHPYSIDKVPEFTHSYIHNKLNLSNNFIESLSNKSFDQLKVQRLYLENNPIQHIDKNTFNNNLSGYLEELYIDTINNGSLEFLCHGTWKKLRILKLSKFNINHHQSCFDKLYRLEKLIIEYSQINIITYHIYKLPFLYELSLANNQIESVNIDDQYLLHTSSIRILNLTTNQLQTVPDDINIRLPHLITVDLSHNFIEDLPSINQITKLNINLSYNLINYLQLDDNQHSMDLSFNPICTIGQGLNHSDLVLNHILNLHCDCRLAYSLNKNLTHLSKRIGNKQPFGNDTVCATPEIFAGQYLRDLTYQELISTCSMDLADNCKEVPHFKDIQQIVNDITDTLQSTTNDIHPIVANSTQLIETAEKLNNDPNDISSFRLTSFNTHYENDDLLIFWDFETTLSMKHLLTVQFQIVIEHELPTKIEIVRQTGPISPYLKQYIIPNLPPQKIYHVCLLITHAPYGTDKYCRETTSTIAQTFSQILSVNRSILLGFLVGTILTICFLITFAFVCHLYYKDKHSHHIFDPHQQQSQQKHCMCIDGSRDDSTYRYSIISSSPAKYHHLKANRCGMYVKPNGSWYRYSSRQLPVIPPRSPCCFLQYNEKKSDGSITTNQINSSSDYSSTIDKEPITSTSIMSNTSFEEPQNPTLRNCTKHVYEELCDTNLFL